MDSTTSWRRTPDDASSLVSALLAYSSDGIIFISSDLRVIAANRVFCNLIGRSPDEVIGRRAREIPGWDRMQSVVRRVRQTGKPVSGESAISDFAGRPEQAAFCCEYTAMPVQRGSEIAGCLFQVHDTTRARMAAQESARLLAQWEALFETIPDPIYVNDAPGHLVAANKAALQLMGVSSLEEFNESDLRRLTPLIPMSRPDGSELPFEERPAILALSGRKFTNYICRMKNTKGQEFVVSYSGGQVSPIEGLPSRTFVIGRDITEVERLEKSHQELVQVISHELKNPFQVIKGLSSLIRLKLCNKGRARIAPQLDLLDNQISSVSRLLEDILAAYRVGSGRLAFQFHHVNLVDLVADSMTPFIMGGTHELAVETAGLTEVSLYCDGDRVSEILTNLLSNAIKYSPHGRRVCVKVGVSDDRHAVVRVEDEGIGIPPDELDKVFQGFYRAGNLPDRAPGGVGLGLHISREFARRHGGDLWAENRPEGGTALVLKLPMDVAQA